MGASVAVPRSDASAEVVIPLQCLAKHIFVFQHNLSGEVMILIDQNIHEVIPNSDGWIAMPVSPIMQSYIQGLKVQVAVPPSQVVLDYSAPPKHDMGTEDLSPKADADAIASMSLHSISPRNSNSTNPSNSTGPSGNSYLFIKKRSFVPKPFFVTQAPQDTKGASLMENSVNTEETKDMGSNFIVCNDCGTFYSREEDAMESMESHRQVCPLLAAARSSFQACDEKLKLVSH
jgi:hypothetical protein